MHPVFLTVELCLPSLSQSKVFATFLWCVLKQQCLASVPISICVDGIKHLEGYTWLPESFIKINILLSFEEIWRLVEKENKKKPDDWLQIWSVGLFIF